MISPNDLLFSYRWGAETIERLVSDVPDERFAEQPVEGINHPAWLLGHVSIYNEVIAALLRGEPFDNPWDAPFGKNSHPTADRSAYPAKSAILSRFHTGYVAASQAIAQATNEAWASPLEHPTWGKQFNTVAPAIIFLTTTHLGLHTGQLSGWRRAAGLPRV
jgi:uncharacterized damage-inducible protein DinB